MRLYKGKSLLKIPQKFWHKEKGNIPIKLKNEDHIYFIDVYYIPVIKHNILSIG
jgi:hypothetical protein